jgi:hypothetical protein
VLCDEDLAARHGLRRMWEDIGGREKEPSAGMTDGT